MIQKERASRPLPSKNSHIEFLVPKEAYYFETQAKTILIFGYILIFWFNKIFMTNEKEHRRLHGARAAPSSHVWDLEWTGPNDLSLLIQGFYKFPGVKKYDFIWLSMTYWRWKFMTFIDFKINRRQAKQHIKNINNDLHHPHKSHTIIKINA